MGKKKKKKRHPGRVADSDYTTDRVGSIAIKDNSLLGQSQELNNSDIPAAVAAMILSAYKDSGHVGNCAYNHPNFAT